MEFFPSTTSTGYTGKNYVPLKVSFSKVGGRTRGYFVFFHKIPFNMSE